MSYRTYSSDYGDENFDWDEENEGDPWVAGLGSTEAKKVSKKGKKMLTKKKMPKKKAVKLNIKEPKKISEIFPIAARNKLKNIYTLIDDILDAENRVAGCKGNLRHYIQSVESSQTSLTTAINSLNALHKRLHASRAEAIKLLSSKSITKAEEAAKDQVAADNATLEEMGIRTYA